MKNNLFLSLLFLLLSLAMQMHGDELTYEVIFIGIEDEQLIETLYATSKLENLTNRDSISSTALKYRAEGDVENLIKTLQAQAYFNAKIDLKIDNAKSPVVVAYLVDTGPIYPLANFKIVDESASENSFPIESITLEDLGIILGDKALPCNILNAEDILLKFAAAKGYPQFHILKREVIADQQKKDLSVVLHVDSGPLTYFGQTTITGHSTVNEEFLRKKIAWNEGEAFNIEDIAKTQAALEKSGLFSSATITYQPPESGEIALPMEVQLIEAKHRSIGGGISYTTQRGLGVAAEWEHRNVFGMGQCVNICANIWGDTQEAKFSYVLPDFGHVDQNLIWQAALEHEKLVGYTESSLSLSGQIDRKVSDSLKISYGLGYKSINTRHSSNNGTFNLLRMPLQLRWSTANSLLDPTEGYSVNLKSTPTVQLISPSFVYCPTTLAGTYYLPLTDDHRVVFAAKGTIGSLLGPGKYRLPPSEMFYAGGENSLRGYKYQTVSPLDKHGKPVGGRSLMTLSLEARFRLSEKIGVVGFYEVGNVYKSNSPKFDHKQLQSVGVGLRYHTPVGPLRFDVAVPLNRRKGIDDSYQIYMSIGQSF